MQQELETLKKWIDNSDNIVFFGGAGVSTESGIPDFRSVDGLYNQQYDYPPETILSHTFFRRNTEEFYRFYRAKMLALDAKPNAAHKKLAQWEQEGKLKAVVTQNIDGLHQAAGEDTLYILYNMDAIVHELALPTLPGKEHWYLLADTGREEVFLKEREEPFSRKQKMIAVEPHTILILEGAKYETD